MAKCAHKGLYLSGLLVMLASGGALVETAEAHGPASRAQLTFAASNTVSRLPQDLPGKKIFLQYCSPCHGPKGLGNGPAASAFNPRPANYTDPNGVPKMTDAQVIEVITKGKGSMPAWGPILKSDQIVQVVAYIRALSRGEG